MQAGYGIISTLGGGGGGGGDTTTITFDTTVAQNDYTAADVPDLANVVGQTLVLTTLDGGILAGDLTPTWDDTTFSIPVDVTIAGGEVVVAFFTQ